MTSVRMLAAGAVALLALPALTAPVRACDDRYIKKCEAESAAAFVAENATTAVASKRKVVRVRTAAAKPAAAMKPIVRAPRFMARRPAAPPVVPAVVAPAAPTAAPVVAAATQDQAPESPMTRRFRGFIAPQSMAVNSFEELRRPRLAAEHLTPAPAIPVDMSASASPDAASNSDDAVASDAAAPQPPAAAPVVPVAPAAPAASAVPAATNAAPTDPVPTLAQSVEPTDERPSGFPFHKLALTICAALGVASALRFIVRA